MPAAMHPSTSTSRTLNAGRPRPVPSPASGNAASTGAARPGCIAAGRKVAQQASNRAALVEEHLHVALRLAQGQGPLQCRRRRRPPPLGVLGDGLGRQDLDRAAHPPAVLGGRSSRSSSPTAAWPAAGHPHAPRSAIRILARVRCSYSPRRSRSSSTDSPRSRAQDSASPTLPWPTQMRARIAGDGPQVRHRRPNEQPLRLVQQPQRSPRITLRPAQLSLGNPPAVRPHRHLAELAELLAPAPQVLGRSRPVTTGQVQLSPGPVQLGHPGGVPSETSRSNKSACQLLHGVHRPREMTCEWF